MNREIEFRGKRLDNSEWLYGDLMHDNQGGCYVYPIDAENLYVENKVDPDTVGQFTGLYDKNGKEIYECDILELVVTNVVDKSVSKHKIRKVIWKDCGFEIVDKYNHCICDKVVSSDVLEYTVVGNIYDNPELLDDK